MPIAFSTGSTVLWGTLAASVTVAILNDFSWPTLALVLIVISALSYWLTKHRGELHTKYKVAEATAALPGRYDNQIWRHKPKLRDLAPGLGILGICGFYFAYIAAHGDKPTRIAKFIYQLFGVPGVVAFWSILAVVMLSKAIEVIVGSRVGR